MTTEPTPVPVPTAQDAEKSALPSTDGDKSLHRDDDVAMVSTWSDGPSLGGAQSFAEVDEFIESREAKTNVDILTFRFQDIVHNIFDDESLTMDEKVAAVDLAIGEMKDRVDDPEALKSLDAIDLSTASADQLEAHRRGVKVVTKREAGADFKASDFASVGEMDKPSTWKLRMAQERSGNFTVAQVGRAITAMQPSGFRGNRVELTAPKDQVVSKIRRAIGRTGGTDEQKANLRERLTAVKDVTFGRSEPGGSFSLKQIGDELWWMGIYSNAFEDRDKETIPESAHMEFIEHCEATTTWPGLQLWHTDLTEFGQTKSIGYADGFVVAIGTIDKGKEALAQRLVDSGPLAMSHGFAYPRGHLGDDGVYKSYRTHEISVLPAGMAANELTGWSLNTEEIQMFQGKQRDFFVGLLGEDETKGLEVMMAKAHEAAEKGGFKFKDVLALMETPVAPVAPTAPTAPTPAEVPTPPAETVKAEIPETMVAVVKGVNDGFEAITKALTDLTTRMDAYEKDDGDKLANLIRPLAFPTGAKAASDDPATIVNGQQDKIVQAANAAEKADGIDPNDPLGKYLADLSVQIPTAG